jgi:ArsR family transcriptional regulator
MTMAMAKTTRLDPQLRAELEELHARICKALNDPKRLLLLYALGESPRTVSELCELLDAPQANISQHLGVLRDRGVVDATRNGNSVRYSLRHAKVLGAIDLLREVMADEFERQHALRQPASSRR